MTKEFWFNLPVKDIQQSVAFFTKIGFTLNGNNPPNDQMASFLIGEKKVVMMLFTREMIAAFSNDQIADPAKGTSVLFSLDAESREEVDEMLQKAKNAEGTIYAPAGEKDGWMYGGGFADLDGHRWNVLYMDFSKMGA